MSTTIDQAFVKEFDSMVSVEYQRTGSKLKGAVRVKPTNNANSVRFPKYGQGEMGSKSRHGDIPLLNVEHTYVEVTVSDYYGGEYIDDLDLIKTNIDEKQLAAQAIANAAGRKVDDRLVDIMHDATPTAGNAQANGATSFTKTKVLNLFETMGTREIPDDGQRYCIVTPKAWVNGLMGITEFTNQDYIGPDMLPWTTGVTAKRWMGILWMQFTGLQTVSAGVKRCIAWHKPAIGLAENTDLRTNFDWVAQKASWLAQGRISCEGVVIQASGLFHIDVNGE
jgi:hypothetical protein